MTKDQQEHGVGANKSRGDTEFREGMNEIPGCILHPRTRMQAELGDAGRTGGCSWSRKYPSSTLQGLEDSVGTPRQELEGSKLPLTLSEVLLSVWPCVWGESEATP